MIVANVYDVKMSYHHGNLRAALIDAGYELARSGGPDAVTVRAAARATGVSAPAAYRHFEDRSGLVAAVGRRCREELARRMIAERDAHRAPRRRFTATGRAYIQFGRDEPGLITCAFARLESDGGCAPDDPDAYAVLSGCLDALAEAGDLPAARRNGAEMVAWSSVHGLALLLAGSDDPTADTSIARVLRGIDDALLTEPRIGS